MPHVPTAWRRAPVDRCGTRGVSSYTRGEELYTVPHWDEQSGGDAEEQEGDILGKTLQGLAASEQTGRTPPDHHYLSLLKACHTRKALAITRKVYEHLKCCKGQQLAGVLGDYLIISMVKCGFTESGRGQDALKLHKLMKDEGVEPNHYTCVSLLKACGSIPWLQKGHTLHTEVEKKGWASDIFIGSSLMSPTRHCPQERIYSQYWQQSLISTYVENGQGRSALQIFCHMQHIGVSPEEWTFVSALQACGMMAVDAESVRDLNESMFSEIGQALHNDVERMGFLSHVFVGNSLITMYNKIGTIEKAESVFAEMPHSNLISWNAMLSSYVDQGHEELALQLYRQMLEENRRPNEQTLTIAINACSSLAMKDEVLAKQNAKLVALKIGQALHADAFREGVASNAYVSNTLITMYSRCGKLADSEHVFQGIFACNNISWNALLSAYAENGYEEKALQLYVHMLEKCISVSKLTFRIILHACSRLVDKIDPTNPQRPLLLIKSVAVKFVQALHADAESMDFDKDTSIASIFMSLYSKCEMAVDASGLFERLCQKDVLSCNVMLSIYVECALNEQALCLYRKMLPKCGVDGVTIVYILQACSDLGRVDDARELHFTLISSGYDSSRLLSTTLIHTYGYCNAMVDVEAVFDSLLEPDIVSWSACIAGYAREGNYNSSLRCFLEMKARGVKANRVAFLSILHLCSHTGLVREGVEYFESMNRDFGIQPDMKCYAGVIDLLGRAGDFTKVRNMLLRLPMQDDLPIWLCILSVCCIHGNTDLGMHAFDCAITLQPEDAASYILMANMCTYDEVLDPVKSFRGVRKQVSLQKDSDPA
ncbi:hypothetical protein GOP47_0026223 [Adiantum capillus-veneris]|nr:hypothetical protein GOP47_0026223 [Adiantum capillus-veneris]